MRSGEVMSHMGYLKKIKRIFNEVKYFFENSYKAFIPVMLNADRAFYTDYKNVGCPFGDSKNGLNSWIRLRKKREEREFWAYYKKNSTIGL
jgi:hypothetical protein